MAGELKLLAVVGNPKVASRTLDVAMEVSRQIAGWLESEGQATSVGAIDIAELSARTVTRREFQWHPRLPYLRS